MDHSDDALEPILKALTASAVDFRLSSLPLLVLPVLLGEAIPFGQLVGGITEKRVL
jgi:hypothetical protein